jgi:hypothetical protein
MSTWRPSPRTAAAQERYAAAEADRVVRPERYRLGVDVADAVVERATRGGGADALGDRDDWRPGLEAYLGSAAEDGRLNALGARMVQDTAVAKLRARTSLATYQDAHPDVARRAIDPPIVIVGGWRTGTTYLFRLLATDPRLRAPLPAELSVPWKVAGLDAAGREALIDASGAAHDVLHLLNPDLAVVHDSGPRLAEECVLAMGTTLRNWGFPSTTRLDGYAEWLAGQDLATEYERHRRVLQILDTGDGRRWVLKAPAHTAELRHLAAAEPGACIVHLHRDIVETVASGASLFATFRSIYSDDVDGSDVGRFQTAQTERWLARALAFRSSPDAAGVTVVDVRYEDLVADPTGTVARIYAAAGVDPPDLASLVQRYDEARPRHAAGTHRYAPADFGIDPPALRERMAAYEAMRLALTPHP